jgi:hypothetical protein
MKKWMVWVLVLFILALFSIYFFIPAKIAISRIIVARVTINGEFRQISQEGKWEKWWLETDGRSYVKGEPFTFNGTTFRLTQIQNNIAGIEVEQDGIKIQSVLHLISLSTDSTASQWQCEWPAGNSPWGRISAYYQAGKISKNMKGVLLNLKSFISDPKNVYGFSIFKTSIRDTTMLSARFTSIAYPTTADIYAYCDVLKRSIQKQKGTVTGFPLIHVRKTDNDSFEIQAALPTNRKLENDGKVFYRRMVPGNFLCAEVKGGPFTVNEAVKQLNFFLQDHNKTQIAIPFQQLVTNRLSEPDTSKWITRVYLPVVE